jgi:peptidoglycan hydrolase-like protein with peptidoglycan-binding domain
MQPRLFLGSTFALMMGVSGMAYAGGGGHAPRDNEKDVHIESQTTQSSAAKAGTHGHAVMSREQTQEMQRALTARNLYQGDIDGVWGPKTESALRNFQTQSGLEATGELNDSTAQALGLDMSRFRDAQSERQPVSGTDTTAEPATTTGTATPATQAKLEDGSTNVQLQSLSQEQAREMQQRLQLLGYYRGPIDGKIGEGTRASLQRYFQRQAELAQQGVISNSAIGMFGTEVTDVPAR